IVFQNSLHNSTLGFISLKYQMLGPGFTISNGCESIERSIDLAHTLLLSGTADFVLVIGGDLIDPKFSEEIRVTYPQSVEQVSFYGAALFGTKDSLAKAGLPATPIELKTESTDQVMNRPFNGSLILDRIREAVEKQESEFELIRPDSSKTKVHLQLG
ncbi:MAG: hypothetical protein KDD25_05225, partial [Bdellovibrionales bacterium]|nr:hypothetical protein [Bdellovibrionales bacterium]